ncbi:hypothetical protein EYF80_009684 [Liparis tanakae]|uniref:Uncharacterized protein n=1 Tax=Liparis tanakae TaxID=230148 RepID=A0A4Z2IQ51_9TELE|nr:hypothetical protein EYF80_009684 [Liparis tanakae]
MPGCFPKKKLDHQCPESCLGSPVEADKTQQCRRMEAVEPAATEKLNPPPTNELFTSARLLLQTLRQSVSGGKLVSWRVKGQGRLCDVRRTALYDKELKQLNVGNSVSAASYLMSPSLLLRAEPTVVKAALVFCPAWDRVS